jgi:hypothetical protein
MRPAENGYGTGAGPPHGRTLHGNAPCTSVDREHETHPGSEGCIAHDADVALIDGSALSPDDLQILSRDDRPASRREFAR